MNLCGRHTTTKYTYARLLSYASSSRLRVAFSLRSAAATGSAPASRSSSTVSCACM